MNLTKNFTLEELTRSEVARIKKINNSTINGIELENLKKLCVNILQPLRDKYGKVIISSGYRCKELNDILGGAKNSQHTKGQAVDIVTVGALDLDDAYYYIRDNMDYDQLLFEYSYPNIKWIHVSYVSKDKNRRMSIDNYKA